MAKKSKFGKILLFTAAVGTAAAAVFHYMQKKDTANNVPEDDDYDDFSEDLEEDADTSRSYVPLTHETKTAEEPAKEAEKEGGAFTPLEQIAKTAEEAVEKTEETVEEFFDEGDPSDETP